MILELNVKLVIKIIRGHILVSTCVDGMEFAINFMPGGREKSENLWGTMITLRVVP